MKYQVIKAFKDMNVMRNVGDIIEVDKNRVGKLLQYRLIGLISEPTVVEKAVKVDIEKVERKVERKVEPLKEVKKKR